MLVENSVGFIDGCPTPVIVRALLQASKFADNCWKIRSIQVASIARPGDIPISDQAYLVYRHSFVLRCTGQPDRALFIIGKFLDTLPFSYTLSPLLNAIYGLLLSSLSWAYISQRKFTDAISVGSQWIPGVSLYETRAEQKIVTARAIAHRHLGRLDHAIRDPKSVLSASTISRAQLYTVASLSDVYCEKQQFRLAYDVLEANAKTSGLSLTNVDVIPLQDTYYRTLLLSFSHVCSCLGMYVESDAVLLRLKEYFGPGPFATTNDQQRLVRTLVLLAQNQHRQATDLIQWHCAVDSWHNLIHIAIYEYQSVSKSGWDYALICLSLHHARRMAMKEKADDRWLRKASEIFLAPVEDHFWIPSMLSNWVSYILDQDFGLSAELRSRIMVCARLS
ncbi:uncharacterized protein M421DRAFT_355426 [Didymella exigua CBS 183.55]|uniref:Uncharacterized protein n=1 Tax=Didymella exigua CBS 183.55 TaxID=1150837 RepID=A0A6A5R720_9PLEO|nr:uncharacterized protein M421DRAFT_355426 [Didymella exigua CBS 183.55]KAF1922516.1 hypothetical protein M421DRAFT_355426 [Didymella exigua CBS 183.55]